MPKRGSQKSFRAVLERGDKALGWTIARVSFEPAEAWPEMIRLRVRGEMNGAPFRTSLFADARGGYYLLVNRTVQEAGQATLGETASFTLEPDLEPRPADLPEALDALLDDEPGLRSWYEELSEYTRREVGKWCLGVKSDEARLRRAQQMAERLLSTMEAEQELPPAIVTAFRGRPKAKAGWARMTGLTAAGRTHGCLLLPDSGSPGAAHREALRDSRKEALRHCPQRAIKSEEAYPSPAQSR